MVGPLPIGDVIRVATRGVRRIDARVTAVLRAWRVAAWAGAPRLRLPSRRRTESAVRSRVTVEPAVTGVGKAHRSASLTSQGTWEIASSPVPTVCAAGAVASPKSRK